MTNLEKMKENLIKQIKALNVSEFEKLIDVFQGDYPVNGCPVDLSKMFSCDNAGKHMVIVRKKKMIVRKDS